MSRTPNRFVLPLVLFMGILSVSAASIFIRFAQKDAPSLAIAALRLTIASLILAPVAMTRFRAEMHKLQQHELLFGLLSGLFLAIHFATWISSLEYTSVASSVVLVSTGPLWVGLLSPAFLQPELFPRCFFRVGFDPCGGYHNRFVWCLHLESRLFLPLPIEYSARPGDAWQLAGAGGSLGNNRVLDNWS